MYFKRKGGHKPIGLSRCSYVDQPSPVIVTRTSPSLVMKIMHVCENTRFFSKTGMFSINLS
ncbi:hypothetical protein HanIR_Chr10g0497571 [Helianthus annuus]|nr:hypothetical protein HanIR_Chr10g0497571 [Helianthus annuus]